MLACAALLIVAACSRSDDAPDSAETASSPPPNLVVVTLDTTRADHLGCYGYFRDTSPFIDALAAESVLFERCLAPMSTTLPSHISLFTGTHPMEHGVLANIGSPGGRKFHSSPGLGLWAECAAGAGFQTAAFVSAAPVKRQTGIGEGFQTFDQPVRHERIAGKTSTKTIAWLEGEMREPFFLWVHYFDPHTPRSPPAPYDELFTRDAALEARMAELELPDQVKTRKDKRPNQPRWIMADVAEHINLYDGEVRYMDEQLGQVLDSLRALPAWERTVVLVVGDHGEGLGQHDDLVHGRVWNEQIHVPLIVRVPGVAPKRVPVPLSIVDIMPTLQAMASGLPFHALLEQASGSTVTGESAGERAIFSRDVTRSRVHMFDPRFALQVGEWKFIHDPKGADQLFNVTADPHERNDVIGANMEVAAELKDRLLRIMEEQTLRGERLERERGKVDDEVDPELARELRALGY